MSFIIDGIKLLPSILRYKLSRYGVLKVPKPLTVTYSVTNVCNSRCKTCNIWKHFKKGKEKELSLDEIEKIFKSIGQVFFFNISGGEPFLRNDLVDITELACKYLKPTVIHSPTNAIKPELVEKGMSNILKMMREKGYDHIKFTIKPSFDGVGKRHDEIRGVKGNFKSVLETLKRLKKLQKKYSNLDIGLGTVVSKFNHKEVKEVAEYVKTLDVDSYINEIAEERSELVTIDTGITPSPEEYKEAVEVFKGVQLKKGLSKVTQAFRLVYYDYVYRIMKEKRQVIPCYAGWTNAHISAYGGIWPCCILGYGKEMGNLREVDYDFYKVWNSKKAKEVRKYIQDRNCYCPLANQAYSNILCDPISMVKVVSKIK